MFTRSARLIQGGKSGKSVARHVRQRGGRVPYLEALEGRTLLSSVPMGSVEVLNLTTVSGWVYNADDGADPLNVVITVNGAATTITADDTRLDLLSRLGSTDHGFTFSMPGLPTGANIVTIDLVDPDTNYTARLKTSTLNIATPSGSVDQLNSTVIAGWVYSAAEGGDPLDVVITLDGVATTITANEERADLVARVGSADHAFCFDVPDLATGTHTVTVDALDPSTGLPKRIRSGEIVIASPKGKVNVVNSSVISGWAFSAADGGDPVWVRLTINGNEFKVLADESNPALVKTVGSAEHAFSFAMPALKPGNNHISIDVLDNSTDIVKHLKSANVRIGGPTGRVEVLNSTTVSGWAMSPLEGAAAVNVVITVNGVAHTIVADGERTDLVAKYGSAYHGFTYTLEALAPEKSTITVDVVDPFSGQTSRLKKATLTNAAPKAGIDIRTDTQLAGWVRDTSSATPLDIQILVDGEELGDPFTADNARKVINGVAYGFDVTGDFAGKVIEVFAFDRPSDQGVLVWTNNKKAKGAINSATGYTITGWAVDPDSPNTPVTVRVDIDGETLTTAIADIARPDVLSKSGALNVGFSVDIAALRPGKHVIKVYAIDGQASAAAPVLLGTKTVTNYAPVGNIDTLNATVVSGWAFDRDLGASPVTVNVYVDESLFGTVTAGMTYPVLSATYGTPNHGFTLDLSSLPVGSHSITVTALDNRTSDQQEIVIYDGFIDNHTPVGVIEQITGTTITGWAYDEDTTDPIAVDVYLDGVYYTHVVADEANDLAPVANRGFSVALPSMSFGAHTIDVYASESQGNVAMLIGSQIVTNNRPIGGIESATATGISGWAADPDRPGECVEIKVYVDGELAVSGTADEFRADVLSLAPLNTHGTPASYGFALELTGLDAGVHQIDVYAVDLNNEQLSSLGSLTVTV